MRLTLLAVGDKMPAWAESATADYLKRLPREAAMALATVKPEKRAGQSAEAIKRTEAARLLEKVPAGSRLVALDEHGKQVTTKELAELLARWLESGKDTVLVIGGADGLAPELLDRAETKLALSRLTLPHALARVLLAEQIYRAVSLLHNHPYHRE
ncbi:MAG: 23S rRNA (pseudouridine(1915)-N(3))-methyltransferase RlmH [Pseudomonadota bacterium]